MLSPSTYFFLSLPDKKTQQAQQNPVGMAWHSTSGDPTHPENQIFYSTFLKREYINLEKTLWEEL